MAAKTAPLNRWAGLVVFLAACFAAAAIGSVFTGMSLAEWYPALRKPSWNPPGWLFAPVWALLYVDMAVAGWIVWLDRSRMHIRWPIALFAIQLALNAIWPGIFFGLRAPAAAFAEIAILWLAILATIVAFARVRAIAAWMLTPYLGWVTFAAALNWTIYRLNR